MTEAEWLGCANSNTILEFLRARGTLTSLRKLRLFAVAACVRRWSLFLDERSRNAVRVAEQFADGLASEEDLRAAYAAAYAAREFVSRVAPPSDFCWWGESAAEAAVACAALEAFYPRDRSVPPRDYFITAAVGMVGAIALVRVRQMEEGARLHALPDDGTFDDARVELNEKADIVYDEVRVAERSVHADLLREIFGNPFREVSFDPAWRTDTALALATSVYATGDSGVAPILADALQDAGCDDETLLAHLRNPDAQHVRGCWALDLVLGKE